MAWMVKRPRSDGSVALSVQWRDKAKRLQSESFDASQSREAGQFMVMVEYHGGWPPGWHRGEGFSGSSTRTVRAATLEFVASNPRTAARGTADGRRVVARYLPTSDPLSAMPVDGVRHSDVFAWIKRLQNRGLAPKTIANVHSIISSAFDRAVLDREIPANPASGATAGRRKTPQKIQSLTPTEFRAICEAIPERHRPLVEALGRTGMRWSEATALQIGDVDLEGRTIGVTRAWVETETRGQYVVGPPKSDRGVRRVHIDAGLVEILTPLIEDRDAGAWLFTIKNGGPVRHNNFHTRVWRKTVLALREHGVLTFEPTIHDLRHAHATWLLEAGQPVHRVAARLGHDPAVLMRTYAHVLDRTAGETADVIGDLLA